MSFYKQPKANLERYTLYFLNFVLILFYTLMLKAIVILLQPRMRPEYANSFTTLKSLIGNRLYLKPVDRRPLSRWTHSIKIYKELDADYLNLNIFTIHRLLTYCYNFSFLKSAVIKIIKSFPQLRRLAVNVLRLGSFTFFKLPVWNYI